MSLETFLRGNGLWTDDVAQYCVREELETVEDLAYLFKDPEEVEANSPALVEAWVLFAKSKGVSFAAARRIFGLERRMRVAAVQMQRHAPLRLSNSSARKFYRPKAKGAADGQAQDKAKRLKAAEAAVRLSLTWRRQLVLLLAWRWPTILCESGSQSW